MIRYRRPSNALADYKGLDSLRKQLDGLMDWVTDAWLSGRRGRHSVEARGLSLRS